MSRQEEPWRPDGPRPLVEREELAGGLVITSERYHSDPRLRELADRVLGALELDPGRVVQVRLTVESICVDIQRWDHRTGVQAIQTLRYENLQERHRHDH